MLRLICGSALAGERLRLTAAPVPGNRLFVVPDDLSALALAREIYGSSAAVVTESTIISFDSLLRRLTGGCADTRRWVPQEVALALVRQLIESDPEAFDYLVGAHSVPRLSHGVLERIAASMESLQKAQQTEEPWPVITPRTRQLQELARRFEERLTASGFRLEKHGQLEAVAGLEKDVWSRQFPSIDHVVFLDFLDHTDLMYLAVNAISRHVERCDVLLEFDPEEETHGHSGLETAYMRFHDMADKVLISPEPAQGGQGDLFDEPAEVEPAPGSPRRPVVISTGTVAQETSAVAAALRKLLDDAEADASPSLVVALTNWEAYAPALEKEFENFGIRAKWEQTRSPLRSGEWLLLERMRECCGKLVSGSALSALFRAPGFHCLLPGEVSAIEAWDMASRLDHVLTLTGKLQGWSSIMKETTAMLDRMRRERERKGLWTEEEGQHDDRLRELLAVARDLLKPYGQAAPLADWSRRIVGIVGVFARDAGAVGAEESLRLRGQVQGIMKRTALQMARVADVLATEPVDFRRFLSLYRTALYRASADNYSELQNLPVTVCSPEEAARMRSDCCMMLGCNDGNFPRFAKPEASFTGQDVKVSQSGYRARQRVTLRRILRNHRATLLWMPERLDTEQALPSQFVEALLANGEATKVGSDEFVETLQAGRVGRTGAGRGEFVEALSGVVLSEAELRRFGLRSRRAYQVAHGISLLAQRSQARLGGYDGVITEPRLKAWLAKWADQHIYSVSQLDSVVGCSFRFFVDRILNLEEAEEVDDLLPAHAFGSFAHDVLASFYRKWVAEGRQVPRLEDELRARHELFKAYAAEYEQLSDLSDFARDLLNLKLFGELKPEGFRDGHRELESVRDPGVFGHFLLMEMERGENHSMDFLKPTGFEVGFGMGVMKDDDPLSIPDFFELDLAEGERIRLRGRIDRIDLSPTGVFAVTDYKTGKVPTQTSILECYRTQLPVYVMIAKQILQGRFDDPEAAGGLYYSLRKGENAKISAAFFRAEYKGHAGVPGRCLKDDAFEATLEQVKQVMRRSVKSVREGYLTTTWRDEDSVCGYCPFEGFCYRNVERTREFWGALEADGDDNDQ